MARMLGVDELQRGAERGLDARIHDVDGVDLVEDQVGEEADDMNPAASQATLSSRRSSW